MKKIVVASCIAALLVINGIALYSALREKKNPNELVLYGNVDVRQVDIGFRVQGKVAALYYEEGDLVPEGALIAVLDQSPYDHEIAQAKSTLASIEASLENAEIQLMRRREAVLVGGVSKEELDNAQSSRDELYANCEAAKANLQIAIDNMNYTRSFAPTDGILLSRIREPGTVVGPADPICTLSISSPVWIRAYVNEPNLGSIYYGMKAEVFTDSHQSYKGQIGFISPVAEFTPKTVETIQLRTDLVYRLRIYVENPDHFLKQGMPVTVKLHL